MSSQSPFVVDRDGAALFRSPFGVDRDIRLFKSPFRVDMNGVDGRILIIFFTHTSVVKIGYVSEFPIRECDRNSLLIFIVLKLIKLVQMRMIKVNRIVLLIITFDLLMRFARCNKFVIHFLMFLMRLFFIRARNNIIFGICGYLVLLVFHLHLFSMRLFMAQNEIKLNACVDLFEFMGTLYFFVNYYEEYGHG